MLAELDQVIHDSRERLRRREQLMREHTEASGRLESVLAELAEVKQRLEIEQRELKDLGDGPSAGFLPDLTGKRAQKLARERAEVAAIRRLVAGIRARKATLQARKRELFEDLRQLSEQIAEVEDAPQAYEDALVRKERLLLGSDDPRGLELTEIADLLAEAEADLREQDEACQAGTEAIKALHAVRRNLNSAHASATWGLLASGHNYTEKYEYLDQAMAAGLSAQRSLDALGGKLASIPVGVGPRVSKPGALWSVDMFFDNVVTEAILRQSISEAYDQMAEMIQWLSALVDRLRPRTAELAEACAKLRDRRRRLLEPADGSPEREP